MSILLPETDLVFRPEPVVSGEVPGPDEPSLGVSFGSRWVPGDGARLLAAIRSAVADRATLRLSHSGAGGMALVRSAQAEHPELHAEEEAPAGVRTTVGWRHWRLPAAAPHTGIERVMITGGLGGIGLYLAGHLVRMGIPVWLVDRTDPAELPPAASVTLADLVSSGAATVTIADLARPVRVGVDRGIPEVVSHVIHAAGTLTPGRLDAVTGREVDTAAWERVRSLHAALSLLRGRGLRTVVVFGSIEARNPNPGFGLYAHANEQVRLAATRLGRYVRDVRFTVAEWSLWSDVGMAAEHVVAARALGYADVPAEWGAHATVSMLADPDTPECLALGGPYRVGDRPIRALSGVAGRADVGRPGDGELVARLIRLCRPSRVAGAGKPPSALAGSVHALNTGDGVDVWRAAGAAWLVPRSATTSQGRGA